MIILTFIAYIVYDSVKPEKNRETPEKTAAAEDPPDLWQAGKQLDIDYGQLMSVAVSPDGDIFLGGKSFLSRYNNSLNLVWKTSTPDGITAVAVYGDTVYAASASIIHLVGSDGKMITEWGPYESRSYITSVSASAKNVGFADSENKRVFILDKTGEVISMAGHSVDKFIIPSPYFDVALTDEGLFYAANTGYRRIETWTPGGIKKGQFGEAGTAPEAFCGCCNPAHFAVIPQGFVTAEKGINRIKILDHQGAFVEFVSSRNTFTPSVPLDIASADGKTIYAANPDDSKLYVFRRKNENI